VSHGKTAEPTEMPFGVCKRRWAQGMMYIIIYFEITTWEGAILTGDNIICSENGWLK